MEISPVTRGVKHACLNDGRYNCLTILHNRKNWDITNPAQPLGGVTNNIRYGKFPVLRRKVNLPVSAGADPFSRIADIYTNYGRIVAGRINACTPETTNLFMV
jgi:hypothetical protein